MLRLNALLTPDNTDTANSSDIYIYAVISVKLTSQRKVQDRTVYYAYLTQAVIMHYSIIVSTYFVRRNLLLDNSIIPYCYAVIIRNVNSI